MSEQSDHDKIETLFNNVVDMAGDVHLRDDTFREETDEWIVDTVYAPDFNKWETAIQQGRGETATSMIPVEQYPDREAAKAGHARWIESMKAAPRQELKDLNLYGILGGFEQIDDGDGQDA